ncbi:MAG: rRNA maturation RNase YbeY [Bacteroidota bacterium]
MYLVSFANADLVASFKKKRLLQAFVAEIFSREKKGLARLQYVFCSDNYLLDMNKQFLQHDTYTDIITFDLSESDRTIGEIYISLDRVRENAIHFKQDFQQEIQRVIFHGALHLCGYKDKKKSEIEIMRHKEEEYLRLFDQWKAKI